MTRTSATVPVLPPTTSQHRRDAELEAYACKRLGLRDLFSGVTTTAMRRDRLRIVLLERGLTKSAAGKRDGKPLTWSALFSQLYGEPLATNQE